MNFPYFSQNGQLLELSRASIPLNNINYQYGFGVYETVKVRNRFLYFIEQHLERLLKSAKIINLNHPFIKDQMKEYVEALIKKNDIVSSNLKILLIGGETITDSLLIILPLSPLFPDKKLYSHGATVSTVHYERFLPNAKTLNMLPSYLFYTEARRHNQYDTLFLDRDDNILEGTRTNFFAIQDMTLFTPVKEKILDGVTRQTVISVAKIKGFTIKEENIPYSLLNSFDGAFLTSTSSKIIPITEIDTFKFTIPSKLKELMQIYNQFLETSKGIFKG